MEGDENKSTYYRLLQLVKTKKKIASSESTMKTSTARSKGSDLREYIDRLKKQPGSLGRAESKTETRFYDYEEKSEDSLNSSSTPYKESPARDIAIFQPLEIIIQEVFGPSKFYFWQAKDAPIADHFMVRLGELYASSEKRAKYRVPSLDRNWPGLACAVFYQKVCYRAIIRSHQPAEKQVVAFLIDYGTEDIVPESDVYIIDEAFTQQPPFAIEAKLAGLCDHEDWEEDVCFKFFSTLRECQVNQAQSGHFTATAYAESVDRENQIVALQVFTDDFKWLGDKMSMITKSAPLDLATVRKSNRDFEDLLTMQQNVLDQTLTLMGKVTGEGRDAIKELIKAQLWIAVLKTKLAYCQD